LKDFNGYFESLFYLTFGIYISIFDNLKFYRAFRELSIPLTSIEFKIMYDLLSIGYNSRLRVEIFNHELVPVNSCEHLFPTADWFECEIWDMLGVFFQNHSNLRKILTDYGFEGYPLRKYFPLSEDVETTR